MDTGAIDLDLLVALDALLVERNVTRAAARLGISQPALSARLARLRDMFGDPLFVPAARGMTPTTKALALEAPLRAALAQLRSVVAAARGFDPHKDALTLHIAASDYTQTAVLLDFALALRQRAPRLRIAFHALDDLEARLEHGILDLALINSITVPEALRARLLFTETYVAITRKDHPVGKRGLTPQAFARLQHIVVSPRGGGFTTPVDAALQPLGVERTIVVSASSFLFVLEMVARSDLIALVPRRLVAHRRDRLCVYPPPYPVDGFSIVMAWHHRTHHDRGQQWVRQQLVDHVARSG